MHLVRVARPVPTARHPLAGLWKADYGVNGIQIVQVSYDFTGMAAKIIAVKVHTKPTGLVLPQTMF